jgi:hypothetical protein
MIRRNPMSRRSRTTQMIRRNPMSRRNQTTRTIQKIQRIRTTQRSRRDRTCRLPTSRPAQANDGSLRGV